MNRRGYQIGPGAASLLLIAVVLCMSVLGMLTLVSAHNDHSLSERTLRMAEATAQLNADSEETLSELDAALARLSDVGSDEEYLLRFTELLPEGVELNGRTLSWLESADNGRRISCAVELAPLGDFPRVNWVEHRVWTQLDEEDPEGMLLFDDPGVLIPSGADDVLEIDLG